MNKVVCLFFVVVIQGTLLAENKDDEIEKLVGHWTMEKMIHEGRPRDNDERKTIRVEFTPVSMLFTKRGEPWGKYKIAINPNTSPKLINLTKEYKGSERLIQGIYKNDGDAILMCVNPYPNKTRPTSFESLPKSGCTLYELKLLEPQQPTTTK